MDSSALIAYAEQEEGGEKVAAMLDSAVVAAPNWAEVVRKLGLKVGWELESTTRRFEEAGVKVESVTQDDAEVAARLSWSRENKDLSLADRFCLAVAERLEAPAYTTDQAWATAKTRAEVVMIRHGRPHPSPDAGGAMPGVSR